MFNVFRECRHKTAETALISELPNLPKFPAGECSQTLPPPPQKLTPFFLDDTDEAKPCFEFSAIFLSASNFAVIILSSILDTFTQRVFLNESLGLREQ